MGPSKLAPLFFFRIFGLLILFLCLYPIVPLNCFCPPFCGFWFVSGRWVIEVTGAPGTLYANETYQLQVDFPENYPMEAPQVLLLALTCINSTFFFCSYLCSLMLFCSNFCYQRFNRSYFCIRLHCIPISTATAIFV